MKDGQLEHLLHVLADRDIDLGHDDVKWAFESSRTEQDACAWVDEYLHTPTLLSQDEFNVYNALPEKIRKQHSRQQSTVGQEVSRPFTDEDVQKALESLERSTASIDAHVKQLETQKEALLHLRAQTLSDSPSVARGKEAQFRKQEREKRQLDILVEELTDELRAQSTVNEKDVQAALDALAPFVNDTIQADDRLLSGLSKLMPKLEQSSKNQTELQEVDQWCRAIVSFRATEVKSRIEAICLPSWNTQDGIIPETKELEEEKAALQAELETLKAEIASVLSMVVDHELRRPIQKVIYGYRGETAKSQREWLSYICVSLNYMKMRLDAIESYAQDARAYDQVLKEFQSFLAEELSDVPPEKATAQDRRRKSRDLRALVNPQTGLREFLLGKSAPKKDDPAGKLLRHFSVPSNSSNTEETSKSLEVAVNDRKKRLEDCYVSTDRAMLKNLAESLTPADTDLQDLLSSVYGYTEFNGVRVSEKVSEGRIHGLETAIDDAVKRLSGLDAVDTETLEQKKDELVAKWS